MQNKKYKSDIKLLNITISDNIHNNNQEIENLNKKIVTLKNELIKKDEII
jgi:hypothetical protein